jgi:hypothetical protein
MAFEKEQNEWLVGKKKNVAEALLSCKVLLILRS